MRPPFRAEARDVRPYDDDVSKHAVRSRPRVVLGPALALVVSAGRAHAQPADGPPPPLPGPAAPSEPSPLPSSAADPLASPPKGAAPAPAPPDGSSPEPREPRYEAARPNPAVEEPEPMSEGRRIVVAYNTGFQWGLSPGVVFSGGKTSFFLGLRFGYGVDTGKVIVVPGLRVAGYFTDPNVYVGMPMLKLIYPIDRFAPFIEGGAGLGYVSRYDIDSRHSVDAKTGFALLVGGGFMIHFNWKFGLGVEANYQTITGTGFDGFGIGPILALSF